MRGLGLGQLDAAMWYGVLAPRGTPAATVERLNADIKMILARADVRAAFETQGMAPASSSPAEFRAPLDKDAPRWARVVREQHIQAD